MKIMRRGMTAVLAPVLVSAVNTLAIEGLQISVQSSNVVLSWPSVEWRNYIVQYRPTLDPGTPWQTLTSSLPAELGTNVTRFVHSNIVQYPSSSSSLNGVAGEGSDVSPDPATQCQWPMVTSKDQTSAFVPLALYPVGVDLTGRVVVWPDGSTGQWSKVLAEQYAASQKTLQTEGGDDPLDDGTPPDTGFYTVVQDGVQIADSSMTNLTNGVLSGTVNVAFEAGNADGTGTHVVGTLSCASLLIDGENFAGSAVLGTSDGRWVFALDTAFLDNGIHWLQILVSWRNPDSSDNVRQYFDRWSDSVMITVSNQIYFPDWEPEIGELPFSAYFLNTTCTDADWQIDIYDSGSNFVQALSGHTMDGIIETYWNMVDTNGVTRTNAQTDPWFDAVATVADPVTKNLPRKNQRAQSWPQHGKWVIAYQDYFKFEYSANNAMKNALNKFAQTAAKYGGYSLYYPQPGQTNDIGQTYPLRYQKTNHFDTNITDTAIYLDETMFLNFLYSTNSRNLYYDGHGDADNIADIPWHILNAIEHRYRFVYLNSCNSANGRLDKAFGINGPKRFDIDYYHRTGIRPAAFMGYTTTIYYNEGDEVWHDGILYDDTIPWQVPGFITNFLFYWDPDLMGYGLLSAITNAKSGLPPVRGQYPQNYLAVHGYFNLHIDEINHRWDTW